MGLREVRRLRGEVGRAISFDEIEKETFELFLSKERTCAKNAYYGNSS
jgi:hypothetical protein